MQAIEKRFWKDLNWARAHHSELLTKYEDEWIAIYDQQIVAHGASIAEVKRAAPTKTGQKHIPVYFVESAGNIYACQALLPGLAKCGAGEEGHHGHGIHRYQKTKDLTSWDFGRYNLP